MLHGCKQRAADFARDAGWLALADDAKVALLLPEQRGLPWYFHDVFVSPLVVASWGANNQNGCFNSFLPQNNVRDRGEALSIRQMIDTMIGRHSIDRSRVFIAGFSAGGAMTAVMLAAYPELFAGGAIVAGVPYRCADDVMEALRCISPGVDHSAAEWRRKVAAGERKFPAVSIWQGDADTRVVPANQRELVEQWTALHGLAERPGRTETGAGVTRTIFADNAGVTRVESVLVQGLKHAFPIETGGALPCGKASRLRHGDEHLRRARHREVLGRDALKLRGPQHQLFHRGHVLENQTDRDRARLGGELCERRIASGQPHQIFLGGHRNEILGFGQREQALGVGTRIGMMIGEALFGLRLETGGGQCHKEFFRIADAGKSKQLALAERLDGVAVGFEPRAQQRTPLGMREPVDRRRRLPHPSPMRRMQLVLSS